MDSGYDSDTSISIECIYGIQSYLAENFNDDHSKYVHYCHISVILFCWYGHSESKSKAAGVAQKSR